MPDLTAWDVKKEQMRARWPGLTEEDVNPTKGREDLVGLLETRLGYARANAEHDIDQFLRGDLIVPRDIADEVTHTGTTSAVQPIGNERASRSDAPPAMLKPGSPTDKLNGGASNYGHSSAADVAGYTATVQKDRSAGPARERTRAREPGIAEEAVENTDDIGTMVKAAGYGAVEARRVGTANAIDDAAQSLEDRTGTGPVPLKVAEHAADGMHAAAGYLKDRDTTAMVKNAEHYVRTHPVRSVAIAVLAAFGFRRMLR